ncbi:hypothetical protein ACQ4PT_002679 [Festuca glaucescens]
MEKLDEILLPGFRFQPPDEELVSFYLKKKIQQKPISIELIRQLDIYKFDPWDLPSSKPASPCYIETEWYFYCPRDRKYRNSEKATGTDRPIYSSEGTRCIGLKKSLVFYRGRAARGMKTDWMMHEFRLPSLTDPLLPKRPIDKNIPLNDSWTICRIFKKTSSMAQRALSHTWGSPMPGAAEQNPFSGMQSVQASHFSSESSSRSLQVAAAPASQLITSKYGFQGRQQHFQKSSNTQDGSSCKVISFNYSAPLEVQKAPIILPFQTQPSQKPAQATPHLFDLQFGQPEQIAGFVIDSSADIKVGMGCRNQESSTIKPGNTFSMSSEWEAPERLNFPFDLGADSLDDWKCNIPWESFLSPTASVG